MAILFRMCRHPRIVEEKLQSQYILPREPLPLPPPTIFANSLFERERRRQQSREYWSTRRFPWVASGVTLLSTIAANMLFVLMIVFYFTDDSQTGRWVWAGVTVVAFFVIWALYSLHRWLNTTYRVQPYHGRYEGYGFRRERIYKAPTRQVFPSKTTLLLHLVFITLFILLPLALTIMFLYVLNITNVHDIEAEDNHRWLARSWGLATAVSFAFIVLQPNTLLIIFLQSLNHRLID
eukprot:GEZU01027754.1.p2 GENE.GEZU01027754.1~~GEZU01027754.1.p2  ORF type:complete len:236 (-),score=68.01 GEZU01027754.1:337-1044(-)